MVRCSTCNNEMLLPPAMQVLQSTSPALPFINTTIDRGSARCPHCDLDLATRKEFEARYPPPNNKDVVKIIEKQIQDACSLIKEDIRKEDLEEALPRMYWKLAETVQKIYDSTVAARNEYIGIWGRRNTQT
ncbi:hypothetical protein B0O99DRAFT_161227 [Bisporella sp. PMI_857]|nr:hypothetical protein B0O99DRAFT_161227 [Bisporella sp. PMI_857]